MNDALNILHGIPISESIAQAAVLEGGGTGPDEGDEALVCVPGVDHVVEIFAWRLDLKTVKLAVPECLQLFELLVYNG
ncbi:hypothetical protein D3C71_2060440 [compost metagenome]